MSRDFLIPPDELARQKMLLELAERQQREQTQEDVVDPDLLDQSHQTNLVDEQDCLQGISPTESEPC